MEGLGATRLMGTSRLLNSQTGGMTGEWLCLREQAYKLDRSISTSSATTRGGWPTWGE